MLVSPQEKVKRINGEKFSYMIPVFELCKEFRMGYGLFNTLFPI